MTPPLPRKKNRAWRELLVTVINAIRTGGLSLRIEEVHVDLLHVDPLSTAPPTLIKRLAPDSTEIGAQERSGWATYVSVSEPHTMADCPFKDDQGLDISLSRRRRAMPWVWVAVSLPFIYLGNPAAVLGCFIMARLQGMENVANQRAMIFSWQSDMVARRIFERLP